MNIGNLKRNVILNIKNIPGPSLRRKLVVIECDDYGGIRTPSEEVYKMLVARGLADPACRYRLDTLATAEDMEALYYTLEAVKDSRGNPAVMTPIINVANPDFEKIRQSAFSEYYFEPFTDTLLRYGRGPEVFDLWKQGMERGIFVPELHGREHLTVQLWMKKLREGHEDLLLAFDHGYVSLKLNDVPLATNGYRAEFYMNSREEIPFLEQSIESGVKQFKELLGFSPRVFVPSNAIFHPDLEYALAKSGIKFLNVAHMTPVPDLGGSLNMKFYRNGKRTASGLHYYVRNCAFEPTDPDYDGVEATMQQIQAAFKWNKPALISTHRANFVGGIEPSNREAGLKELNKLLNSILKRWPDAEFMSSAHMFKALYPGY